MPLRGTTCYENRVVRRGSRSQSFLRCTLCRKAALVPPFTLAATVLPLFARRTQRAEECALITAAYSIHSSLRPHHAQQRSVQVNPPFSQSQSVGELLGISFERIRGNFLICSHVHLQQKGRAPGNEGSAEGCAPGGGVVPAGIGGNDPFPRSRQFDVVVSEVGKRTPSIQIAG